jgi:hypothetical protein
LRRRVHVPGRILVVAELWLTTDHVFCPIRDLISLSLASFHLAASSSCSDSSYVRVSGSLFYATWKASSSSWLCVAGDSLFMSPTIAWKSASVYLGAACPMLERVDLRGVFDAGCAGAVCHGDIVGVGGLGTLSF